MRNVAALENLQGQSTVHLLLNWEKQMDEQMSEMRFFSKRMGRRTDEKNTLFLVDEGTDERMCKM